MISETYLHLTLSYFTQIWEAHDDTTFKSIITTDINVLHFGSLAAKRLLKIRHWWLKNKERKADFRFVERRFLAAINLSGSAEGELVPVLLCIAHWTKSGRPVSPPGLFPPCSRKDRAPARCSGGHGTGSKFSLSIARVMLINSR